MLLDGHYRPSPCPLDDREPGNPPPGAEPAFQEAAVGELAARIVAGTEARLEPPEKQGHRSRSSGCTTRSTKPSAQGLRRMAKAAVPASLSRQGLSRRVLIVQVALGQASTVRSPKGCRCQRRRQRQAACGHAGWRDSRDGEWGARRWPSGRGGVPGSMLRTYCSSSYGPTPPKMLF